MGPRRERGRKGGRKRKKNTKQDKLHKTLETADSREKPLELSQARGGNWPQGRSSELTNTPICLCHFSAKPFLSLLPVLRGRPVFKPGHQTRHRARCLASVCPAPATVPRACHPAAPTPSGNACWRVCRLIQVGRRVQKAGRCWSVSPGADTPRAPSESSSLLPGVLPTLSPSRHRKSDRKINFQELQFWLSSGYPIHHPLTTPRS